jgi:hypothetical protein
VSEKAFRSGVFFSYSHKDKVWLDRLHVHLKPYLLDERVDLWDDTRIAPGADWAEEIARAIDRARVAVLLVSPDFLASDYVAKAELPKVLERAGASLTVVWIPVRASAYEVTPIARLQAAHDPKRPLASLPEAEVDAALVGVARKVAAAVSSNVVANGLRIIDDFSTEVKEFVTGRPEPPSAAQFSVRAVQDHAVVTFMSAAGPRQVITAADFERLDADALKLIRAYERTMKKLFERWTELKPKRFAEDPEIRREAREEAEEVRRGLCEELTGLLGFIESMHMSLDDHYYHVRHICRQAGG